MSTRNELSGHFSDNWRRGGMHSETGAVDAIVGAIAFMADVQRAQVQLATLGYSPGVADGKLGPNTAAALKKFQTYEGLTQTSTLDDATKKRLNERTTGMTLKLADGKVLPPLPAETVLTPTTNFPTTTADPTDLWQVVAEAQKNAVAVPGAPAATTPAIPPVPGLPASVPQIAPSPPPPAAAPEEKKIFGLSMKTVTIGGVGALVLAGIGVALSMRKPAAARPSLSSARESAPNVPMHGMFRNAPDTQEGVPGSWMTNAPREPRPWVKKEGIPNTVVSGG